MNIFRSDGAKAVNWLLSGAMPPTIPVSSLQARLTVSNKKRSL